MSKRNIPNKKHKLTKRRIEILNKAKSIWKDKNIDAVKYQREIRSEWDEREKELEKLQDLRVIGKRKNDPAISINKVYTDLKKNGFM